MTRLKRAVDGCLKDDWAMGRVAKAKGKTYNDLGKHICVSDEAVERFEGLAVKPAPVANNVVELRPRQAKHDMHDPFKRPLDRALVAIRREYGYDAVDPHWDGHEFRPDEWWSVCPLHPHWGHPLRIRERGLPGASLDVACVQKCLPSMVLEAIAGLEAKREQAMTPGATA